MPARTRSTGGRSVHACGGWAGWLWVVVAAGLLARAGGAASPGPAVVWGRLAGPDSVLVAQGSPVPQGRPLTVVGDLAYVAVGPHAVLRMDQATCVVFAGGEIRLVRGTLTVVTDSSVVALDRPVVVESGLVRHGGGPLWVVLNGQTRCLCPGHTFPPGGRASRSWLSPVRQDAAYLLDLMARGLIPSASARLSLPSLESRLARSRVHVEGGVGTYRGVRYYLAEALWRSQVGPLRVAYGLPVAMSREGRWYAEAWDEWDDLVHHVEGVELFTPRDPLFVRVGHLEGMVFGEGLLVDGYTNGVFVPFERTAGLVVAARLGDVALRGMAGNVAGPGVVGVEARWETEGARTSVTGVVDVDQYTSIPDTDGDSYPDEVDPAPHEANEPDDSLIVALDPFSMRGLAPRRLAGAALSVGRTVAGNRNGKVVVGGEMAVLSSQAVGFSLPTVRLESGVVEAEVGGAWYAPRFTPSVFDQSYELEKSRLLVRPDGSVEVVTRGHNEPGTTDWHYGVSLALSWKPWTNSQVRATFRNAARGTSSSRRWGLWVETVVPWVQPLTQVGFFFQHRDIGQLLPDREEGGVWGGHLRLEVARGAELRARYSERRRDRDGDGRVERGELERSVSTTLRVDTRLWWGRVRAWRRGEGGPEPECSCPPLGGTITPGAGASP